MATSGFEWDVTPEEAFVAEYDAWVMRVEMALLKLAQYYAAQMEAYMKASAPWTDRTGNLRQSLYTAVQREIGLIVIELGYGLQYGDFLEFGSQGKWAVIAPTMDYFRPKLFADARAILQ
jgi:hypothetical protein